MHQELAGEASTSSWVPLGPALRHATVPGVGKKWTLEGEESEGEEDGMDLAKGISEVEFLERERERVDE